MAPATERRNGGGARTRRAAFTLVELLLVVVLVGGLFGLGLGVFGSFDFADRATLNRTRAVLRSAHNWAVARSAPARVVIDRAAGRMHAEGSQVVGTWQFETLPPQGAFGFEGSASGVEIVDDGFQGRALSFGGRDASPRVEFAVQHDPSWDFARGFLVRCAVRRTAGRGGSLLDCGGAFAIEIGGDGTLRANFAARRVEDETAPDRSRGGGRVLVETAPGRVEAGRWTRIEVSYDGRTLRAWIDGVLAAYVDEDAQVAPMSGPLVLSPSREAFAGAIDALSIAATVADEPLELPVGVTFPQGTPAEIVFRAGGSLDPDVHREPVRLFLESGEGRRDSIVVTTFGTVE